MCIAIQSGKFQWQVVKWCHALATSGQHAYTKARYWTYSTSLKEEGRQQCNKQKIKCNTAYKIKACKITVPIYKIIIRHHISRDFYGGITVHSTVKILTQPTTFMSSITNHSAQQSKPLICSRHVLFLTAHTRLTALFRDYPGEPVPER